MGNSYGERLDRRQMEWAVKELRERGTLSHVKGISPGMDRRIKNAERRLDRKDKR
jgi:hypothetical protein